MGFITSTGSVVFVVVILGLSMRWRITTLLRNLRSFSWLCFLLSVTPSLRADLNSGLVAEYLFDGSATDLIGGHNGACTVRARQPTVLASIKGHSIFIRLHTSAFLMPLICICSSFPFVYGFNQMCSRATTWFYPRMTVARACSCT